MSSRKHLDQLPVDAVEQAVDLFKTGQIEDGRLLISRACQARPQDVDAWTVAAWEWTRWAESDPQAVEGRRFYTSHLGNLAYSSCEYSSIATLNTYLTDMHAAQAHFKRMQAAMPRSQYGHVLFQLADIAHDEMLYQIARTPVGESISLVVTHRLMALAALIMRDHTRAIAEFRSAEGEADDLWGNIDADLDSTGRHLAAINMRFGCRMGRSLTLTDIGAAAEALEAMDEARAKYDQERSGLR